jgi:hypothetical protein
LLSRYLGLCNFFDRAKERRVALVEIVFISIIARRLKHLATEEVRA